MAVTTIAAVKTVLVADDTAFVRDRFKAALEGAGHRTLTVGTGPELLAKLRQNPGLVDLVVLDLWLPQGHGMALLRAIRRIDKVRPAVVVFSGTIASVAEVRDLSKLGVAGYVNEYTAVPHIVPSLLPHLSPDHENRRSSPRAAIGISVSYRFGNTIASALTLNISQGGLALRTTSPLEAGTPVKLRFRLPAGKIEIDIEARVAWVDRRMGMGLQFTKVDAAAQAAIDGYIQGHFFSNRKA